METKEKILSCAEELFYLKGYDGTGVQEIAGQAGITKPTLYYYFGSKRGLLDQLLETKFNKLLRETGTQIQKYHFCQQRNHYLLCRKNL